MLSVLDAMAASKGFVRPIREGEQLLQSGMIVSVGRKGKEEDVVHVQALVLRTSGIQSKDPAVVELWVDTSKDFGERVVNDNEEEFRKHCDCPAGNSEKCKHIMAVMLCLASVQEDELEDLSCTDTERQWGALKASTLKEFEAKRLSDLCHVKGPRNVYASKMPPVTKEMEDRWRERLMNSYPLGEYSMFMSGVRSGQGLAVCEEDEGGRVEENKLLLKRLFTFRSWRALGNVRLMTIEKLKSVPPAVREFYEKHVAVTLDQAVEICSAVQGTPQWHRARKLRLTVSKARAQYTYYFNKKADWDARFKEVFQSTWKGNADTLRGLTDEVSCREKYEERECCKVLQSGLVPRPEVPWLACSLDGTKLDEKGNPVKNFECKSFKEGTRLTCAELVEMQAIPTVDMNGNIKKKHQHYAQMELGMLLSGIQECDYCIWSQVSLNYVPFTIHFDEEHVLELCSVLVHVYFDEFLPRIMRVHGSARAEEEDEEEEEVSSD